MQMTQTQRTRRSLSDRQVNRLIIGTVVALVIVVPLIGVIYFLDRNTSPGPSIGERAVTAGETAVRQDPNNVDARMALATAYTADLRYGDAIGQYTEILKVIADHHGALLGRGNAYLMLKDDANAAKDFQRLADLAKAGEMANADPQLEEAYYRLGAIALRAGRNGEAVTNLSAALFINHTDADALALLGSAYVNTGKAGDAVTVLDQAIALVPSGWCDPYQTLASAYQALGKPDGVAYANGMVAFCSKQPDVAVAALTPLTTGQFAVSALLGLGLIAEQQADVTTATRMYGQALAKDPKNFDAIVGLQRLGTASSQPPAGSAAPGTPTAPITSPGTSANP